MLTYGCLRSLKRLRYNILGTNLKVGGEGEIRRKQEHPLRARFGKELQEEHDRESFRGVKEKRDIGVLL